MTVNWVLWSYRMSSLEQIDRMLLGELLLLPLPHLLPLLLLHHQPSPFLQLKKLLKVWWMTLDHRCLSLCLKQRCQYQLEEKQAIVFFNVQSCAKFQWVSCLKMVSQQIHTCDHTCDIKSLLGMNFEFARRDGSVSMIRGSQS